MTHARVVESLLRFCARARGELRPALLAAVARDGALRAPMAERVLDLCLARYTPEALRALRGTRYEGRAVRVVLAASVATAPLRALALPLLQGATVSVKPSSRQGGCAELTVREMAREGVAVSLDVEGPFDAVVAYGRDETLEAMCNALPEGVTFEGHGHGFGVGIVAGDVELEPAAEGFALDVALHDQRGCLSPQAIFVVGDLSRTKRFAEALDRALAALVVSLPRGVLDLGLGASVAQWQGVQAALGARVYRGDSHAVVLWPGAPPLGIGSPGARNIPVVAVSSLAAACTLLTPHARWLSCVGITEGASVTEALPRAATPRVCHAGTMQDPPLDGPEDPRAPVTLR